MENKVRKKSKTLKTILIVAATILAAAIVLLSIFWNRYLNKNNLIARFDTPQEQKVYLLGAFHKEHFNKWLGYSMEDLLSVVENVQPDVVFIEARESYFKDYGVVDGPIDMAVVYSYCAQHQIPVEMVDWWIIDNEFKENTTNDKRDDMIFANIADKLKAVRTDARVLVVCGGGHFYAQSKRFLNAGLEKQQLENRASYFDSKGRQFEYPAGVEDVWEKRVRFYAYTLPEIVARDESLNSNIKSGFAESNHDAFYEQQMKYYKLFSDNKLYD